MPTPPKELTDEIGTSATFSPVGGLENWEENPELQWPFSTKVYHRMRRTDGQVRAVERSMFLPMQRAKWDLIGKKVDKQVMDFCQYELGLQDPEESEQRRQGEGIDWGTFLRHALLHLPYGHMFFEQLYTVGLPPPGMESNSLIPPVVAHLAKLGPRMPSTISDFRVARDGGLEGVVQSVWEKVEHDGYVEWVQKDYFIPVDRLVYFINEQEGGDYYGTSTLRAAYPDFFFKDNYRRLSGQIVERNGMGVPVTSYMEGNDKADALRTSAQLRAGETSGVAVPESVDNIKIMGVTGTLVDPLPFIKYHDQAMARSMLAMFLDLGHENGARSLGDTFLDVFLLSLNATTEFIGNIVTKHVIRDLVKINFGDDVAWPTLRCEEITAEGHISPADLKTLSDAGIITPDGKIEDQQRTRYKMPDRTKGDRPEEKPEEPPVIPGQPGGEIDPITGQPLPAGGPPIPIDAQNLFSANPTLRNLATEIESLRAAVYPVSQ